METPIYRPNGFTPAYCLRWVWTGWPSSNPFPHVDADLLESVLPLWEDDGIRLLEKSLRPDQWSITVSTRPSIPPSKIVARLKGRLDHAMRKTGIPISFSRKVSLRSVGDNVESQVREYIANQVEAAEFVDDSFAIAIAPYSRSWLERDTGEPLIVASGRYWYQLHIVLVTDHRYRYRTIDSIAAVDAAVQAVAASRGYLVGSLAVLPDHVHVHLRGLCQESPEEIVHAFQNGVADRVKISTFWQPTYYVGTVGVYNMRAIRQRD